MARTTGSNKTKRPNPPTHLTDWAIRHQTGDRQPDPSGSAAVDRQRRATMYKNDRQVAASQLRASARRNVRGMY